MATNEQIIWQYLKQQGLTDAGAAGLMGNLYAESGFKSTNLQNSYEKKLGYNDDTYTKAVDNGLYTNFVRDKAGYGLAQWTYWSRKQNLLNYAKQKNKSIGDLTLQLDFLMSELTTGYKSLLTTLKTTDSVKEASDKVLTQFECPADQGTAVQNKRAAYGQIYYDKYAKKEVLTVKTEITNSPLATYRRITPNRTSPRNHIIDTISIHCIVGQWTAKQGCDYFATTKNQASANYVVGKDGSIGISVDEKDRSWCTSSRSNDHRAITIEVASDTKHPYAITDAAYEALIKLLVDICQRNPGINRLKWKADKSLIGQVDKQNMTVHRWFANKACPGEYLYSRHGQIAEEVNRRLDKLEGKNNIIVEEEEEVTQEQFNAMMNTWIANQSKIQPGDWSKEAREWGERNGLINGDTSGNKMYKKMLTREEFIAVLYRALHRNIID